MTESQLAYNLLRAATDGQTPNFGSLDASMWWSLFRLMQQNHVAAMTADTVAALDVPREVKIPWLAERDKAERWHRYQREVQQEIVDTVKRHGIETLVLKGTHVAQYYPRPEAREFGDLDLYFYDKHDEADRVAREVLKVEVSNDAHHHSKYNYRGVTVESHYDFVNVHYPPSNRRYEALLKELVPSPTFEVLFLLRHMSCHFASSRITLRELTDWALTCRALQGEVDWKRVQQSVDDYGMRPFASALNLIAERQLGIVLPLQNDNNPDILANTASLERDIVFGSPETDDKNADGLGRLTWKMRRWNALAWKRKMVYSDSPSSLMLASLTSHAEKPRSILHKM
jgi:hypothetical protein